MRFWCRNWTNNWHRLPFLTVELYSLFSSLVEHSLCQVISGKLLQLVGPTAISLLILFKVVVTCCRQRLLYLASGSQGRLSPSNTLEQVPPPLPLPLPLPSPFPFLPLPYPPLRSRAPLLRLVGLGSALAPPAGPGGARPLNGIWWISGKNLASSSNDLQELFRKWNIKLWPSCWMSS